MINILIADDHQMFREGLVAMLGDQRSLHIMGQAGNGEEVLDLMNENVPEVLLLDIEMPGMDGFDTIRAIKRMKVPTKVLVLTMHGSAEFIKRIMKAGAHGYLPKEASQETLLRAIRTVHVEGSFYSPDTQKLVMDSLRPEHHATELSPREKEVVQLIADGLTTKKIAEVLFISKHTVETHRQNILLKLGLKNSAELVKYAIQHGIL